MSKVKCAYSSSYYLQLWKDVEKQIEDEYSKFIGVESIENGDDQLELDERIKKLRDLAEYYRLKYSQAYDCENSSSSKPRRLKTHNNGL